MLHSPHDILTNTPIETAVAISILAFALALPSGFVFVTTSLQAAASDWLERFRPVVYLEVERDREAADRVAEELEAWSDVQRVELRTRTEALERTGRRLGTSEGARPTLTRSMFPHSLVVEPAGRLGPGLDVLSRLAALETRDSIEAVDLPSSQTRSLLSLARWGLASVFFAGVSLLSLSFVQLTSSLDRWCRAEADVLEVLGLFGMPPDALRRRTEVRGLIVGVGSGLLGGALSLGLAWAWYQLESELFGSHVHVETPWRWGVVVLPFVLGPGLGYLAGMWSAHTTTSALLEMPELEAPEPDHRADDEPDSSD